MTSPKYQIGQDVAVFDMECCELVVIPSTVIEAIDNFHATTCAYCERDLPRSSGWNYKVAGFNDGWIHERHIRPIQPGEYLTDSAPQKLETTL